MQGLTNEVKQFVLDQGMDLVGIASTDKLDELTPKGYHRPKDLLAECNMSIVMALRWSDTLIDGLPQIRAMYSRMMIMMNNQLDQTLLKIVRFLTKRGFLALPIHASDPYDLGSTLPTNTALFSPPIRARYFSHFGSRSDLLSVSS